VKWMSKFCAAPWFNISTDVNGSIRPCCRYSQPERQVDHIMPNMKNGPIDSLWNSPAMFALRQAFLDGKAPKECNWCWREEEVGVQSFRENYNQIYQTRPDSVIANPPTHYDLKLSNVCNLKCRMCTPTASSSILKELKAQGDVFKDADYYLSNKIIGTPNEEIFMSWLPTIEHIELTGGEPFTSNENKLVISMIANSAYAQNITILITTNGTHYNKKIVNDLKKFKQVRISVSVDDLDNRLEYARHGSNWNTIKRNTELLAKDFHVAIYCTVNNYNIFYLDDLYQYCLDTNINYVRGFLHEPEMLSIKNLHPLIKQRVLEKYQHSNSFKDVVDFMMQSGDDLTINMHRSIDSLDKIRGESFEDVFPEWSDVICYWTK
jgi:MoaA/NifB/PqqE/SkfB family radical SAM enzyme